MAETRSRSAIVVGGGVFGLGAAISLQRRGWKVTVFERYVLPSPWGSSNDINRMIRSDYGDDEFFFKFANEAIDQWHVWNRQAAQRGMKPLFNNSGVLFARKGTLEDPTAYEAKSHKIIQKHGKKIERLSTAQGHSVGQRFPGWSKGDGRSYTDGYFNSSAGWADAGRTVEFMVVLAKELGVKFCLGTEGHFVKLIEGQDGTKAVQGIVTADNVSHYANIVLIAAGPWSPSLVPELNDLIRVVGQPVVFVKVPDSIASTYQSSQFPTFAADISRSGWYGFPADPATGNLVKVGVHGNGFISKIKMADGRECSIPVAGAQPPQRQIDIMRTYINETWPDLRDAPIVKTRLCYYCDSWDSYFYISGVPARQNLFVATGGSGHGFKFAPVLGDVIADCIENKPNAYGDRFKWRSKPQADAKHVEACRMSNDAPEELPIPHEQLSKL